MTTERFGLAIGALVGAAALLWFGRQVWDAGASGGEPPGIVVRSEMRTIFAPKALIAFAREHPGVATNDELIRLIREARLAVWMAVVFRGYHGDGRSTDIAISYRPGERPECFGNTRAVLRRLAGYSTGSPDEDRQEIEIRAIEDDFMEKEPIEGLRRLLRRDELRGHGGPWIDDGAANSLATGPTLGRYKT
jgi:hypothetical protein